MIQKVREILRKKPWVTGAVAVGVLGVSVLVYALSGMGKAEKYPVYTDNAYYVDLETKEETVLPSTNVPPLMGKAGKATVVRAVYYGCGDCIAKRLAYYEKFDEKAKEMLERLDPKADNATVLEAAANGHYVMIPGDGESWVLMKNAEKVRALSCTGARFTMCPPGAK